MNVIKKFVTYGAYLVTLNAGLSSCEDSTQKINITYMEYKYGRDYSAFDKNPDTLILGQALIRSGEDFSQNKDTLIISRKRPGEPGYEGSFQGRIINGSRDMQSNAPATFITDYKTYILQDDMTEMLSEKIKGRAALSNENNSVIIDRIKEGTKYPILTSQ